MHIIGKTKTVLMTIYIIINNIPEIRYLVLSYLNIGLHIDDAKYRI